MNSLIDVVLTLLLMAFFLWALFYVVRTAVKEGMQIALRKDLLDERQLLGTDRP